MNLIACAFKIFASAQDPAGISILHYRLILELRQLVSLLNWIPVEDGKAYYIPAGTVHAIGKGVVVCEIQQSSNCTYRLYDYDRTDRYGNRRQLHVEKA